MKFLPYEKLSYNSPLKKEDAIKRLSAKIDPNPPFLNWKFGKLEQPFRGTLKENKFMISKILTNSMSSGPFFFGEILETEEGSAVRVIIKPFSSQTGYYLVFLAVFLFLFVGLLFIILSHSMALYMLFPIFILLFPYTIWIVSFKFYSGFAKDDLKEILEVKGI